MQEPRNSRFASAQHSLSVRFFFYVLIQMNLCRNNIATHVGSQNNDNNKILFKKKKTITGNTERKEGSPPPPPRINKMATTRRKKPCLVKYYQQRESRPKLLNNRHYYCLAWHSVWVCKAGQHLSSAAAPKLSFHPPAPAAWSPHPTPPPDSVAPTLKTSGADKRPNF